MMHDSERSAIAEQLIDLEAGLRQANLWSAETPSIDALQSEQPFAMDKLELEEWLQFIFIPTLYELLDTGSPLPDRCSIAPMAEETLDKKPIPTASLIATIRELDRLITETD